MNTKHGIIQLENMQSSNPHQDSITYKDTTGTLINVPYLLLLNLYRSIQHSFKFESFEEFESYLTSQSTLEVME